MSDQAEAPSFDDATAETPSLVRYSVLTLLCALAFVLYVDRVCIGQAATSMQASLHISNTQWGFVSGAFTLAYMLFEVPTGHWGDRYGSRGVLLRIVLWWSAFTALTGCVWASSGDSAAGGLMAWLNAGFLMLLLVRFLFGVGEAGAFPNVARVLEVWFPAHARGVAQGAITSASLVGGAAAPVVAGYLIRAVGWRVSFGLFGLLGVFWCVAFALWYRDRPEEHPGVNAAELKLISDGRLSQGDEPHGDIPWARILSSANLWLMGAVMNCGAAVFYMLFSWYATYLKTARGVSEIESGWQTSLVMSAGAIGCLVGGYLNDALMRLTGERRVSRRIIGCSAFLFAGLAVLMSIHMERPIHSTLYIALAFFFLQVQIPAWWGVVTDISGKHVGSMFGLMNSMGGIGAISSPIFLGWLTDHLRKQGAVGRMQWDPGFYVYVGLMVIGALCWTMINPERSIVDEPGADRDAPTADVVRNPEEA